VHHDGADRARPARQPPPRAPSEWQRPGLYRTAAPAQSPHQPRLSAALTALRPRAGVPPNPLRRDGEVGLEARNPRDRYAIREIKEASIDDGKSLDITRRRMPASVGHRLSRVAELGEARVATVT